MIKLIQLFYYIPVLISAILSYKSFKHNWPAPYKMFSRLLFLVLLIETGGIGFKLYQYLHTGTEAAQYNLWWYNSFLVPQYLLYIAVFYLAIRSVKIREILKVAAVLFAVLAVCNMLFLQTINKVNSYTLIMASGIVLFCIIVWFNQSRKDEEGEIKQGKIPLPLKKNPMAWIALGALIFHIAFPPYILGLNYLTAEDRSLAINLFYLFQLLNFAMYTFYSIAFLCKRPLQ
jgi:hypothetical protein